MVEPEAELPCPAVEAGELTAEALQPAIREWRYKIFEQRHSALLGAAMIDAFFAAGKPFVSEHEVTSDEVFQELLPLLPNSQQQCA